MALREILIETKQIGNSLRVSAMDAESGTEITFQAPAKSSPESLKRLAASKIKYVLSKK